MNSLCRRTVLAMLVLGAAALLVAASAASAQDEIFDDVVGEADYLPLWRARGEYLHWWTNGNPLPPLVTTSPANTPRAQAGVLGTPGAEILFGDDTIDTGGRSGGRVTLSRWLEDEEETVVEFVGMYVADDYQSGDFVRESGGLPILARPFLNAVSDLEDSELVAFPSVLAGRVEVDSYSEIYSAAALLRQNYRQGPLGRVDLVGGYRYLRFRETLSIREALVSTDPGGLIPLGTQTGLIDQFSTGNDFHGGEIGVVAEFYGPRVSLELLAKLALGGAFRKVTIDGQTTVAIPDVAPTTTPGGLLALPTNEGTYTDNAFGVLPELGINATVAVTSDVSLVFGYSLIVFNDVLRSGAQIDRSVNPSQLGGQPLGGPARPAFSFDHSNLVLQGVNVGLEARW